VIAPLDYPARAATSPLVSPGEVASLDDEIMRFFAAHRTPALTAIAEAVETAGDSRQVLWLLGGAALAVVLALGAWRVGVAGAVALVAASVAADALKAVVQRPRPDAGFAMLPLDGWSMPSGHAARTAAVSLAVLVAAGWSASGQRRVPARVLAWAVAIFNLAVGVFMVYLGAHWPTDVLAGWVLGAGIGWTAGRLARALPRLRTARPRTGG
jgi:membrane-associated phospholipid phosphatase